MNDDSLLRQQLLEMRIIAFQNGKLDSPTDTSNDLIFELMLKRAKYIALGTLYPYDLEITELPQRIKEDWQVRCACELFDKLDNSNVQSYSENGLAISYFTDLLPESLMKELTPKAGVPK